MKISHLNAAMTAVIYSSFYQVDSKEYYLQMRLSHYNDGEFDYLCSLDERIKFIMVNPPIENEIKFIESIKERIKEELQCKTL